jgi:hypothetical protein
MVGVSGDTLAPGAARDFSIQANVGMAKVIRPLRTSIANSHGMIAGIKTSP